MSLLLRLGIAFITGCLVSPTFAHDPTIRDLEHYTGGTCDIGSSAAPFFFCCWVDHKGSCKAGWIEAGWKYLNSKGVNRVHVAPETCSRVSCSWNSAIWYCNRWDHWLDSEPTFDELGHYTRLLFEACQEISPLPSPEVQGVIWVPSHDWDGLWSLSIEEDRNEC